MGIMDWILGKSSDTAVERTSPSESDFGRWEDPPGESPASDWERRLFGYARKCALQLEAAAVPLFRSKWPRSGVDTYVDSFWLIALDVERASRSWHENSIHSPSAYDSGPGHPPIAGKGDFTGFFRGPALLLTKSGKLCTARTEGFLSREGGVNNRSMDLLFHDIAVDVGQLQRYDWGWSNRGRWRRYPKDDLKAYGLQLTTQSIRFEERQASGANSNTDGRGTSAALSSFVKTNGSIRWPRHFVTFDYD